MPARPAAATLLLAAVAALSSGPSCFAQGPPPVTVPNAFFETVDQVDLAAERPGMLRSVPFREGDSVATDEVVADLWDEVPRAQLATLELQAEDTISEQYAVEAARVAQAELRGITNANRQKSGVFPAADVERARLSLKQAKAQILKARQERELAKLRADELRAELQSYSIAAPFPGVVQRVLHLPGESVRQGDPVLRLVNTDRLRVVANVPLEEVLLLRKGDLANAQPVSQSSAGGPAPLPVPPVVGRVTFIDPTESIRNETNAVRVFVEVENPAGLYRAGMRASLQIRPGTAPPPGAGDAADFLDDDSAPLRQSDAAGGAETTRTTRYNLSEPGTVPRTRRFGEDAGVDPFADGGR